MTNIVVTFQELGKCSGCGKETEVTTYHTSKQGEIPLSLCAQCKRTYAKRHTTNNQYEITPMQYKKMLVDQKGLCAVCGKPEEGKSTKRLNRTAPLSVDHDHATGKIRALLCRKCNSALGMLDEDPERMEALAKYIRKHKG